MHSTERESRSKEIQNETEQDEIKLYMKTGQELELTDSLEEAEKGMAAITPWCCHWGIVTVSEVKASGMHNLTLEET